MAKTTAAEDVLLFWPNLIGYSRVILMLAFFGLAKVNWQYAIICYCSSFAGDVVDELGLIWKLEAMYWSGQIGLWLLWIAAALTLITGIDYFAKALPHLKDDT